MQADQLADLTQVYAQYVSAQRQADDGQFGSIALDAVTFDGKIMAIPALTVPDNGYQVMSVGQDWLATRPAGAADRGQHQDRPGFCRS